MGYAVTVGASHGNVIKPFGHLSIVRTRRFVTKFDLQYSAMSQAAHPPELQFFDGRGSMRNLPDGLEKLHELQADLGNRPISIKTLPIRLPTGELTAIVALIGPEPSDAPHWAIALPSCAQFLATTTLGGRQRYDVALLNDATVDIGGNVRLTNDIYLHNIELVPTTLRPNLTDRQEIILYFAIFSLQARDRCLRPLHPSLPYQVGFDYGALSKEKLPSLKELERRITKRMPDAKRHEIATTLAIAGMRQPRSGPRANRPAPTSAPRSRHIGTDERSLDN
jgi:hypothetical protein